MAIPNVSKLLKKTSSLRVRNPLERYFWNNEDRLIHKWLHYFEIYHSHLKRFRGKRIVVVEFGVSHGGSLQMWRRYFGKRAKIYGVDIDPRCRKYEESGTTIFIGDQENREFLSMIADEVGEIDVLIEDGGHHPGQQIATFEVLYPKVKEGGVFLIEDLHTSYWGSFSGGLGVAGTFMEYAKGQTDKLNAWHTRVMQVDDFTKTTKSMHFYDSVVVYEKGAVVQPTHPKTGVANLYDKV